MNIDLTPEEAQWISILLAADLEKDDLRRIDGAIHQRNAKLWEKLQPVCQWDREFEE